MKNIQDHKFNQVLSTVYALMGQAETLLSKVDSMEMNHRREYGSGDSSLNKGSADTLACMVLRHDLRKMNKLIRKLDSELKDRVVPKDNSVYPRARFNKECHNCGGTMRKITSNKSAQIQWQCHDCSATS